MSLRVLVKPKASALVALATVRSSLGLDSAQDSALAAAIAGASSACERYVGRPLARTKYREALPGNGRAELLLSSFPVDPDQVVATTRPDHRGAAAKFRRHSARRPRRLDRRAPRDGRADGRDRDRRPPRLGDRRRDRLDGREPGGGRPGRGSAWTPSTTWSHRASSPSRSRDRCWSSYANALGLLGGLFVGVTAVGLPAQEYIDRTQAVLTYRHILAGLIKGLAFGIVTGLAASYYGLKSGRTAGAVGLAVRRAVVAAVVGVVLADAAITLIFKLVKL